MPKKTFSPQKWDPALSDISKPADVSKEGSCILPSPPIYNKEDGEDTKNKVELVISEIETRGIDITSGYDHWRNIAFALSDEFGESGRDYFHRVSRQYPGYKHEETDHQYTACLNSKGSGITIGTFFAYAKSAGVDISCRVADTGSSIHVSNSGQMDNWINGHSATGKNTASEAKSAVEQEKESKANDQISNYPNIQSGDDGHNWISEEDSLPTFSEQTYTSLPPILKDAVDNAVSKEDRPVILLGVLACISATLYNVSGVYRENTVFPNLYVFISADAGMGKGALTFCKKLVQPIHDELIAISERQYNDYKAMKSSRSQNGEGDNLEEPGRRMFIIPANSSASSFCQILNDNGGIGLLFETEADALGGTLNSDYGNYSYVLRQAAHHEPVTLSRVKDRTYFNIDKPRLSVCISGTPQQMTRLIPSAENGLFSRFCFYNIPFKLDFGNVLSVGDHQDSKDEKFRQLGIRYCNLRESFFRRGEYQVRVPDLLCPMFHSHFKKLNEDMVADLGNGMQGVVRRHGLIAFRIMMILTALRTMTNEDATYLSTHQIGNKASINDGNLTILTCSDEDFQTALDITDVLLCHSAFRYNSLPKADIQQQTKKSDVLFESMPYSFTRKDYDDKSREMKIPLSTSNKWLAKYIKSNRLERTTNGNYRKIQVSSNAK